LPLGEVETKRSRLPLDLRAWDVVLVKTSGGQISIGQVIAASNPDLVDEGFDRAVDVAEAVGELMGKPVVITAAVEEPVEEAGAETAEGQVEKQVGDPTEGSQQA
jgi:hypothetical protein